MNCMFEQIAQGVARSMIHISQIAACAKDRHKRKHSQ